MPLTLGQNLAQTFHRRVAETPARTAMLRKRSGVWSPISWRDYERHVFTIAAMLEREGVKAGDRVAIFSLTRPEWAFVDLAILSLGAVTVPVYASVTPDDVHFILSDSGARFAFVGGAPQIEKLSAVSPRLPDLQRFVSFDAAPAGSGVLCLDKWMKGEGAPPAEGPALDAAMARWRTVGDDIAREALATIVYTSGTEGLPKGVRLTHGNFVDLMRDAASVMRLTEQDLTLAILPAAHIIGRLEQMLALAVGWTNAYGQGEGSFADNILEVRPTVFFGVPRLFERIRAAFLTEGSKPGIAGNAKGAWMAWALGRGVRNGEAPARRRLMRPLDRWQFEVADRTVLAKVRDRFGGRLRFALCGGAPLPAFIAEFFEACGVLVLEGYGLTETTGPIALNTPESFRFGSVGRPLPRAELRFEDNGDLLVRGPMVTPGYQPSAGKESVDAFDKDGWFRTGDVGYVDDDGFLFITDRKKSLIVSSSGLTVAPLKIERRLSSLPLLSQCLVAGDGRAYVTALLTLNTAQARSFCERNNLVFRTLEDLAREPVFQRKLREDMNRVNSGLAEHERVKRYSVLPRDFSIEAGELTPSYKVKRTFCLRKYADLIEEMYR